MIAKDFHTFLDPLDSTEAVHRSALALTRSLGYERYSIMAVVDGPHGYSTFFSAHNAPTEYVAYDLDPDLPKADPVMRHVKRFSTPIAYSQATYTKVDAGEVWELQAPFGYGSGVCVAMHPPGGRHLAVGIDRSEGPPSERRELQMHVERVQAFVAGACDSAFSTLTGTGMEACAELTESERKMLQLVLDGKRPEHPQRKSGASDLEARRLLYGAVRKLNVTTAVQAALRAQRLGALG